MSSVLVMTLYFMSHLCAVYAQHCSINRLLHIVMAHAVILMALQKLDLFQENSATCKFSDYIHDSVSLHLTCSKMCLAEVEIKDRVRVYPDFLLKSGGIRNTEYVLGILKGCLILKVNSLQKLD